MKVRRALVVIESIGALPFMVLKRKGVAGVNEQQE